MFRITQSLRTANKIKRPLICISNKVKLLTQIFKSQKEEEINNQLK